MEITHARSRPTGISIIAVLLFIAATLDIVYGLLAMFSAPTFVISSSATMVVTSVGLSPLGSSHLSRRVWFMDPARLGILGRGHPRDPESHRWNHPIV